MQGRGRDIWRSLEPRGQLTIIGAVLAAIVLAFVLFRVASKPSYTALATGLEPADSSQVADALSSAGIGFRLANGGTEVDVVQGKESQARVALAAKGLPRGGHVGFEIFDKQSLGATDFQQQVNFQRALEGEIARTIEGIEGISSAQVQLVLPQDDLFADQGSKASAAVLVDAPGGADASTVRGIAHLVASSVKGLDTKDVTITDSTGTLLWPTSDSGSAGATTKLDAEQQYSAQLTGLVNAMLTRTLGADKSDARVHATLNVDQTTQDSVAYGKGKPLSTDTQKETLKSNGSAPAGPAGTASNVPGYVAATSSAGTSDYSSTKSSTQFGVDKTVTHTIVAPGEVQKVDVAVLFDKTVPADQVVALKNAVSALVGLDPTRGDTISTEQIQFAKQDTSKAAPKAGVGSLLANPLGLLKYVVLGVGSIVFLFLMRRGLRKREGEGVAPEPTWLRQIEGSVPVAQLGAGPGVQRQLDDKALRREAVRTEVEEIVKKEPDRVASQVGQWLRE
jgi:flagellar M-ring protein FliF